MISPPQKRNIDQTDVSEVDVVYAVQGLQFTMDPQTQVQAGLVVGHVMEMANQAGRAVQAIKQQQPSDSSIMNDISDKVVVLSFQNLQLKRIGVLQDKLIALALRGESLPPDQSNQGDDQDVLMEVDEVLRAYAQALRDYETLTKNAVPFVPIDALFVGGMRVAVEEGRASRRDKFGERLGKLVLELFPGLEGRFIRSNVLRQNPGLELVIRALDTITQHGSVNVNPQALQNLLARYSKDGPAAAATAFMEDTCGKLGFRELDQQGRLRRAENEALTQRIVMGLFGGISLICPVLIMVLHPSRNTNLVTVSVATILFASALAYGASDSTGKDVLASTAAYAAVLVVFFGTSGSS